MPYYASMTIHGLRVIAHAIAILLAHARGWLS